MMSRLKIFFAVLFTTGVALLLLSATPALGEKVALAAWNYTGSTMLAVFFNPNNADLRFEIGNHYFGGGAYDPTRALGHYERALALDPILKGAHYQLARINFLKGNFGEALYQVDKELALAPDFKKAYYLKGLIEGYAGDLEGAVINFKKFISMDPFNWAGHNDLAWIYFKKGDYRLAKEAAEAGLGQAAGNPWLENTLGLALLNLGDKEGAREQFEAALRSLSTMTPLDWGKAYPGNDPAIYEKGLEEMRSSISYNLSLAK